MSKMKIAVIIPALNEEESIAEVIEHIPSEFRAHVFIGDNGSTDRTAEIARSVGASVVAAPRRGYGSACLAALAEARALHPDAYVFLDADYSDYPEDMAALVCSMTDRDLDLVIGTRMTGLAEPGSLLPQARLGNWLASWLLAARYGYRFTDLGPFRVIRAEALDLLEMSDPDFGWTMEMQIKALRHGLRVGEVPVRYRKRIGKSKITGTIRGTLAASYKILWTLGRYSVCSASRPPKMTEKTSCIP